MNTKLMQDKICMITGANRGIGKATALGLAEMGATIVMVCRNRERGEAALAEIRRRSGNDAVFLLIADLGMQASVRWLAVGFKERFPRLDVLINNAAVITHERTLTRDGIESQWAVNHLAPFILTNLLIDWLSISRGGRVINLSSNAHRSADLNFSDLQSEKSYHPKTVYAQTKLANVMSTYELARRLSSTGITANCLFPGLTATQTLADYAGLPKRLDFIPKLLLPSPEKGAQTVLYLASSPEVEGITGKYFVNRRAVSSSPASYDVAAAKRLWEISEKLTNLPFRRSSHESPNHSAE